MHWVRSNIRWGACLALIALAVQLTLSFGHVHAFALGAGPANAALATLAQDSDGVAPANPAGIPKPDGLAGSDCAICALIQLFATAAPAAPPVLLSPAALASTGLHSPATFAFTPSPHSQFQARAPPSV